MSGRRSLGVGSSSLMLVAVVVLALLACKKKEEQAAPAPVVTAAAAPVSAAPPVEEKKKFENFAGEYISTWGKVKCTQALDNVNCLYTYSNGSLDCKIKEEKKLDCKWDENGGSGKAQFTKKDDGKLVGTWGRGTSSKNGGTWIFTPKK